MLRLLDCYVLALTGHLEPAMEAKVGALVRRTFGGGSDWKGTLRRTVDLPADPDEKIRALWRAQPADNDSLAFAIAVSDENFVPLIDPL